jgi:hypothetical protein
MKVKDSADVQPCIVKTVHKIGPTHAHGLDRLVGLNANIRQGEPLNDMRLDFELSCSIAPISFGENAYEMALRTCFVSLDRKNCEVQVGTAYESWLERGAFKVSESRVTSSQRSNEANAGVGAEIDSMNLLARMAAKFRFGVARKHDTTSKAIAKQDLRTELVITSGQDRWRIGDLIRGDPRRADRILSGAYFREEITSDGDPVPLCRLFLSDERSPMQVTISATASFGSLLIFKEGAVLSAKTKERSQTEAVLRRRSRQAEAVHGELLRAYIAGLVAAKKLHDAQVRAGAAIAENEFLIGRLTVNASTSEVSA